MVPQRQLTVATVAAFVLATYWVALAVGVDDPLVTHGVYLALHVLFVALVIARAVRRAEARPAWAALAVGLSSWTLGSIWQVVGDLMGATEPPFPSVADLFWLGAYPFVFASVTLLARPWLKRVPKAVALEALAVGFGTTAVVAAATVPWVVDNAAGLSLVARAINLVYPLADSALLAIGVIGAAVAGWRAGRTWALLSAGALALVVGDTLWVLEAAAGTWAPVMSSNAVFPLWPAFAAAAAWYPTPVARTAHFGSGVRTRAAALVSGVLSIGLLAANAWLAVPDVAIVLAALSLLLTMQGSGRTLADSLRAAREAAREREMVEDVRDAMDNGELDVYFQPLVRVGDGEVVGAEALLRWRRADGVFVPPDVFLPAVERSELMRPLTDWVLDRALAAAAGWHRSGHRIGVSVNLATGNLSEPDLPGRVLTALRRNELGAGTLTLEITETAAVEDNAMTGHVLRALRDLGVELSVDDFGTGHSSLARLAEFPISELKVDRSFVADMHTSERPIVATSIQLAQTLGLRVVAEGVEDQRTLDALVALGCDLAQGYYFSRPLPAVELAGWLNHPVSV
ncbi:EAL domain-containing protein (putative c-di-GMP-specific phosphodiesterase class I) [Solirubrobacter pauli]|uniref:EAL domain-containing protein (Putative c-di-GMP-specific phosphodiesterase class I) n=1 Tax=Solirubrobacter pauli TaxID=166793 RepID=A0A660L212_9ACTN|nr:EAL domain-containing protein [Solirubrobacter pauli]RKQ87244.1 EAL domain-containing protein (putative c-di-GMP-specific phosphodiesterase class I) [Solirubrobacter pauli]